MNDRRIQSVWWQRLLFEILLHCSIHLISIFVYLYVFTMMAIILGVMYIKGFSFRVKFIYGLYYWSKMCLYCISQLLWNQRVWFLVGSLIHWSYFCLSCVTFGLSRENDYPYTLLGYETNIPFKAKIKHINAISPVLSLKHIVSMNILESIS